MIHSYSDSSRRRAWVLASTLYVYSLIFAVLVLTRNLPSINQLSVEIGRVLNPRRNWSYITVRQDDANPSSNAHGRTSWAYCIHRQRLFLREYKIDQDLVRSIWWTESSNNLHLDRNLGLSLCLFSDMLFFSHYPSQVSSPTSWDQHTQRRLTSPVVKALFPQPGRISLPFLTLTSKSSKSRQQRRLWP